MNDADFIFWLVVWLLAAALIPLVRWKHESGGSGLGLAFAVNLWLIHWPAVLVCLLPWHPQGTQGVGEGFVLSAYAIVSFVIGNRFVAPFTFKKRFRARADAYEARPSLAAAYMAIGALCYLVLGTALSGVPSATAMISAGKQLFVVGLCLACWKAWQDENHRLFASMGLLALSLPFITILVEGFIGYGTAALIAVFAFLATFVRPRWIMACAALAIGYLGISVYVSYARDRDAIRQVVWGGQSFGSRVSRAYDTMTTIEWIDLGSEAHLNRIDERLNQNRLVSAAVQKLSTTGEYAYGETLQEAALALIPRVIWPDKPVAAGSGTLVSEYTDIKFAEGTSVGIGNVMEFYVNFGTFGVLVGFVILGIVVNLLSEAAGRRLARGDWQGFALWQVAGMAFLQVGGSLVEVTASSTAALIAVTLINRNLLYRFQKRHQKDQGSTEGLDTREAVRAS